MKRSILTYTFPLILLFALAGPTPATQASSAPALANQALAGRVPKLQARESAPQTPLSAPQIPGTETQTLSAEPQALGGNSQSDSTSAFLSAVAAFAEEDYNSAHQALTALYEQDPSDDAVCYYLGMCEFVLGERTQAEEHLSRAVQADSTNAWYLHALSSYYNAAGNRAKFAELGEKLIRISPSHAHNSYTLYLLGDANYAIRRDSLALHYFDKSLEADPNYAPAEFGRIEVLRSMHNYPQFFLALEQFYRNPLIREGLKLNYLTNIMDAMNSQFYWLWGKQVISLVDLCLEQYPQSPQAHLLKFRTHLIKGDQDAALSQCEQMARAAAASKDNENLAQAYYLAGDIYHQQGNTRATYRYYDKALAAKPDYLPVLNNYAYYLSLQRRKLRKALEMSAKTIELEPDNATYLDTYGWILYLLRRPAEAKPHFKRAMLYGGKDSATILEHYAAVLRALGDPLAAYYQQLAEQKSSPK